MDDDVGAMGERILDIGREEGVVDNDQETTGVGGLGDGADIDEGEGGVAGRLDPDQLGAALLDQVVDVLGDGGGKRHINAVGVSDLGEIPVGSAIDIRDRDDVRAWRKGLENDSGGRGAGREGERIFGALQGSNGLLKLLPVRIRGPRVLKLAHGLADAGLRKRRRERNLHAALATIQLGGVPLPNLPAR